MEKIGFSLLTLNSLEMTKLALGSFMGTATPGTFALSILDNGSDDGTKEWLKENHYPFIDKAENIGIPKGHNENIRVLMKDPEVKYICIIHNDMIFMPHWYERMICLMRQLPDYALLSCCVISGNSGWEMSEAERINVARALEKDELGVANVDPRIYRRVLFEQLGLFDENFGLQGCEDCDFYYRLLHAGYKYACTKSVIIYHKTIGSRHGLSGANAEERMSEAYWAKKYPGVNMQHYNTAAIYMEWIGDKCFRVYGF